MIQPAFTRHLLLHAQIGPSLWGPGMDTAYGFDRDDEQDMMIEGPPPVIGSAERRMHVRAYDHWVSLLQGRPYPSILDLDLNDLPEFEPRSVVLDYRADQSNPRIIHIGRTLREECGHDAGIRSVADVPRGSLLSRLTDHFLEIIGTGAPIGWEAEFTNHQKLPTLYRGILMPFSSSGASIDHVLGVINWKHALPSSFASELQRQMRVAPAKSPPKSLASIWDKPLKH
jgi:hypothetical protein